MITKIQTKMFYLFSLCDAPASYQIGFQDPATPVMEGIIYLHDYIWIFLIFILFFVSWIMGRTLFLFEENNNYKVSSTVANVLLEIIWTLTPAIILSFIGANSISHLYSAEEVKSPQMDVTIVGNQWFWTYEFMVFTKKISIESHLIDNDSLTLGQCRNLEVDNPLVLPIKQNIRLLVTSNDVIHSWAVPSLGVKIDAIPGRINSSTLFIKREGRYYGQCSEICGKSHAAMPIVVVATSPSDYYLYLHSLNCRNYDIEKVVNGHNFKKLW